MAEANFSYRWVFNYPNLRLPERSRAKKTKQAAYVATVGWPLRGSTIWTWVT